MNELAKEVIRWGAALALSSLILGAYLWLSLNYPMFFIMFVGLLMFGALLIVLTVSIKHLIY